MRRFLLHYLIPRFIQYITIIFVGITVTFIIPRLSPTDPVEAQIAQMLSRGNQLDPQAVASMREALTEMYGLSGSPVQQYFAFGAVCSGATLALRSPIFQPRSPR